MKQLFHFIATFLVLVAGINWGVITYTKGDDLFSMIGVPYSVAQSLYYVIAILSVYLFFRRDTWLPFLGQTFIPPSVLQPHYPEGANVTVVIEDLPANVPVIYWASQEANISQVQNWKAAYGKYLNSGVSMSDSTGRTTFAILCPQVYSVGKFGISKQLDRHVHYRYAIDANNGMFSPVYTKKVANC